MKPIPKGFELPPAVKKIDDALDLEDRRTECAIERVQDSLCQVLAKLFLALAVLAIAALIIMSLVTHLEQIAWPRWGWLVAGATVLFSLLAVIFIRLDRTDRWQEEKKGQLQAEGIDQRIHAARQISCAAGAWTVLLHHYARTRSIVSELMTHDEERARAYLELLAEGLVLIRQTSAFWVLKTDSHLFDAGESDILGWLPYRSELASFIERARQLDRAREIVNAAGRAPLLSAASLLEPAAG